MGFPKPRYSKVWGFSYDVIYESGRIKPTKAIINGEHVLITHIENSYPVDASEERHRIVEGID
jgi:hypothetical protein